MSGAMLRREQMSFARPHLERLLTMLDKNGVDLLEKMVVGQAACFALVSGLLQRIEVPAAILERVAQAFHAALQVIQMRASALLKPAGLSVLADPVCRHRVYRAAVVDVTVGGLE